MNVFKTLIENSCSNLNSVLVLVESMCLLYHLLRGESKWINICYSLCLILACKRYGNAMDNTERPRRLTELWTEKSSAYRIRIRKNMRIHGSGVTWYMARAWKKSRATAFFYSFDTFPTFLNYESIFIHLSNFDIK